MSIWYITGNIPDAHLNTTVNLAFAMDHSLSWSMVPEYIIAKILSVIVGAILVWLAYLWYWEATEEPGAKRLAPGSSVASQYHK